MKDEVLDPPASPMEAAIAQGEGVSVAELREWRLALLELQGRSGGPPSTRRLYRLLRKGKGVPAGVAFSLADFLKESDGALPVVLAPAHNPQHTARMQRSQNRADRVRIGREILADIDNGKTVEKAVAARIGDNTNTHSRSYLMKCYRAAREDAFLRGTPSKEFAWVSDHDELQRKIVSLGVV